MLNLITAASHAAAYKLERVLNFQGSVLADYQELPQFKFSGKRFVKIPQGNSASYAHELLNICLDGGIDKVFPLYSDEILPLAQARQLFYEYGISVIVPAIDWLAMEKESVATPDGLLVIIEAGRLLAGELPPGVIVTDLELSGCFRVTMISGKPDFKLFTV